MSPQEISDLCDVRLAMKRRDQRQKQFRLVLLAMAATVFLTALLAGYAAGRLVEYLYANA